MIEIVGTALHQWDVGRYVQVTGVEVEYVHFANKDDSKAVIVGAVDITAKIPDHLLQTGKQLCVYAVKDGITVESKIFYVKTRERPDDYVYEEEQRDFIYALIDRAEKAIDDANMAAEDANNATDGANTATVSAKIAADNANKSADSANLAAKNANEAADKANHTAKSLMVVGSAAGDSIHLDDAIDQLIVGLRVFGKTTQLTTKGVQMIPMPYKTSGTTVAGITFEEQVDGGVKCTGTAISSAYYPLCGGFAIDAVPIPDWLVAGETYTISGGTSSAWVTIFLYKENGAAWQAVASPEFTFVMPAGYSYFGIFAHCAAGVSASDTIYPMLNAGSIAADYEPYTGGEPSPSPAYPQEFDCPGDSGGITVNATGDNEIQSITIATPNGLPGVPVASGGNYTDANGQQWICDEIDFDKGVRVQRVGVVDSYSNEQILGAYISTTGGLHTGAKVLYALNQSIKSALPTEVIEDYKEMRTYRGKTTVSNDASAHMEIEYVMDAKKYIDSMISSTILQATVE